MPTFKEFLLESEKEEQEITGFSIDKNTRWKKVGYHAEINSDIKHHHHLVPA